VPIVPIINATATCTSAFNSTLNLTVVTCTGTDLHNFVKSWQLQISNVTSIINTTLPIGSVWFNNTSSFSYTYNLTRKTTTYNFRVIAYATNYSQTLYSGNFQQQSYTPFGTAGAWIGIALFLFSIGFGNRTKGLSVAMGLVGLLAGIYISAYNMPFYVYLGIAIVGIVLIYHFESKQRGW
jgi:hypothetical protein